MTQTIAASPLEDQLWRLRNLYSCREEGTGKPLDFVVRPEQYLLFRHLIETPQVPAYIVKSRRLGISTAVDTFQADSAVFSQGWRGLIIDQTQMDATKKMVEIVRFAVDSLDPAILAKFIFDKRNDSELRLRRTTEKESEDSVIYATTGGRGGDCSMLHVSEWGPIAATDPTRSQEIRTGAFPAARLGRRVVETTWYGGKHGDLWELINPIMERDPNAEGVIYFFPWHADPAAIRTNGMVTVEIEHYFRELASKLSKSFSPEQKKWYAAKKLEQGIFVRREYPSTLDEAFSAPVEGAIYAEAMTELRVNGRILPFEWDRSCPVFSAWDLGWSDSTSIWLWQLTGRDKAIIWHTERKGCTAAEMVHELTATGIPIAAHYLPHDAANVSAAGGVSYRGELTKAGLINLYTLPQPRNIWPGINAARDILPTCVFNVTHCQKGIEALESYHLKTVTTGAVSASEPVHDWSSHTADAFRIIAEALVLGMVHTAVARKHRDDTPRMPDGSMADADQIRQMRAERRNRGMAISTHTL